MAIDRSSLNNKLTNLSNGLDLSSPKNILSSVSTKSKASTLTEMGKVLGEVKGGFEGLTINADNAVEALAGQLDANGFPSSGINTATITKLDKSVQASVPALKTALASHSSDISALVSSSHGTSSGDVSSAAPTAKALTEVAEGLMDDIITDGSPEAIAGILKTKANVSPNEIKSLLSEVANSAVKDIVDVAADDLLNLKLPADMGFALQITSDQLNKVLNGLNGGNLMKAAVENFSKDISNAISNVAENIGAGGISSKLSELINLGIGGNMAEVANEIVKSIPMPNSLKVELTARGIQKDAFSSLEDLNNFIASSPGFNFSETALKEVEFLSNKSSYINNNLISYDTSLSSTVTSKSGQSRNPVVDPSSYYNNFEVLNSEEEIVKYLQSATREITTVVWHWTANYSDQGYIGSKQIDQVHKGMGWNGIGYHFIVKRDGTIETGRNINKVGAHTGGFNTRSIGIAFVAGYKCASTKYKGTPPFSEVSVESITQAQHQAFKKFMAAWYRVYPGGQAWGHVDFPNNKGKVDPGFDVAKRCYELFGKKNVGHPKKDGEILTAEAIASKRQFT